MTYRSIDTGIWSDPFMEGLRPYSKLLFVYLWTNSECNQAGLYQISKKRIEFDLGYELTEDIIEEIWPKAQVHVLENIVWVKNFLKRQCANEKFYAGAMKCLPAFPLKFQDMVMKYNMPTVMKFHVNLDKNGVSQGFRYELYGLGWVLERYVKGIDTHAVSDTDTDQISTDKQLGSKMFTENVQKNISGNGKGVLFDQFWTAYPKKVGKAAAKSVFDRIMKNSKTPPSCLMGIMVLAIDKQKKSEQWKKDGGQFIPHPRTWLNQGRWEDVPDCEIEKGVRIDYAKFK